MAIQKSPRSISQVATTEDISLQIARGQILGHSVVHKFGRAEAVGTSFVCVSQGSLYNTPAAANATVLRVKAGGDATDTVAGVGARKVMIEGLDATGVIVSEELSTNGVSAGTAGTQEFWRVTRAYVSESGTAAVLPTTDTQAAAITVENGAGGTDWFIIADDMGQTEIGAFTVPLNHTAYIRDVNVDVGTLNKGADVILRQNQNGLTAAAPFKANRAIFRMSAVQGHAEKYPYIPLGPFPELTDITVLAQAETTSTDVNIEFTIILIKNSGTT